MKTIREISPFGAWTGASESIANAKPVPLGWTVAPLPQGYAEGDLILWDGGAWILPDVAQRAAYEADVARVEKPPVPEFVTRAQAKVALDDAGLFDQAAALIAQAPRKAQIWWAEADTFRRDNEWVALVGGLLGLTAEKIDELFINADKIS